MRLSRRWRRADRIERGLGPGARSARLSERRGQEPVLRSLRGSTSLTRAFADCATLILRKRDAESQPLVPQQHPLPAGPAEADEASFKPPSFRRGAGLSFLGTVVVAGALAVVLAGRSGQFSTALHTAPIWALSVVVLLQVVALLARSEAWNVAVRAAGGTVPRRLLFRAASAGYLASQVNGSLGLATRIASLRRLAPQTCPRVPALMAVEVPIIAVEVALAAVFSFTLVAPLGVPGGHP